MLHSEVLTDTLPPMQNMQKDVIHYMLNSPMHQQKLELMTAKNSED